MALDPLLDVLAWLVQQVPPTAKVWSYDRIAVEADDVEEVFGMPDAHFSKGWSVRSWMADRLQSEEAWATNSENTRLHTLRIQGFWELHDASASRKAFRTATEDICTMLRRHPYLGPDLLIPGLPGGLQAALPDAELVGPPDVQADGLSILGDTYLCHSVQVILQVQERLMHTL